ITVYPDYADAHNNLGVLFLRTNQPAKAREQFQKALAGDPQLATAHVNLARIAIAEKNYQQAEADLDKAVTLDPQALNALTLLTSTAYSRGEFDKALETERRVHSLPHHQGYADVHLVS